MSFSHDAVIRNPTVPLSLLVLPDAGVYVVGLFCFQDDNATRDLNDQLEALKAHLDYVQENITEAQTEIADLEVSRN